MVPLTSLFIVPKMFFQQAAPALLQGLLKKKAKTRLLKIHINACSERNTWPGSTSEARRNHHCIAHPLDGESSAQTRQGKSLAETLTVKGLLLDTRVVVYECALSVHYTGNTGSLQLKLENFSGSVLTPPELYFHVQTLLT